MTAPAYKPNQSPERRAAIRVMALDRELLKLAARAGVSLEEAKQRREAGQKYCSVHGWDVRVPKCITCRPKYAVKRAG